MKCSGESPEGSEDMTEPVGIQLLYERSGSRQVFEGVAAAVM